MRVTFRIKNLCAAAIACTLLAGCGEKPVDEVVRAAQEMARTGQCHKAVIDFRAVLQRKPDHADARFGLGSCLLDQGDYAGAAAQFAKAAEANFDEQILAPKAARANLMQGKYKEVIDTYRETNLKDAVQHAELRAALGAAYLAVGQVKKGEAELAEALSANPKDRLALMTKARIFAVQGQFDQSLGVIDQILGAEPNNGEANMLRGSVLRFGKRDPDAAVAAYTKAAADSQTAFPATVSLANLALAKGNLPAAREHLAVLKKRFGGRLQTKLMDAQMAYIDREFDRAKEVIDQLLRVMPENRLVLTAGGAIDLQRGALVAAETKLARAIQSSEAMPLTRKFLAEVYLRMGQHERAQTVLKPLIETAPDRDALALVAQAHLMAGNLAEAEVAFNSALKSAPGDPTLRTAVAMTELARGQADQAFSALESISKQDPSETADLALINARLKRREFAAALTAVEALQRKQPKRALPLYMRGVVLQAKGDLVGARTAFESAAQAEQGFYEAVSSLVGLDIREHKIDAAMKRLDDIVQKEPRNIAARVRRLDLMVMTRAKPAAIRQATEEAIKANAAEPAPHLVLIRQLSAANDVKGALLAAQAAAVNVPDNVAILNALGAAQQRAGDLQQAINSFQKVASLAPRSPKPHLTIASIQLAAGNNDAANRSTARAFEIMPDSPDVHRFVLLRATRTKDIAPVMSMARELQRRRPDTSTGFMLEAEAEAIKKNWPAALKASGLAVTKPKVSIADRVRRYELLMAADQAAEAERFVADVQKVIGKDTTFMSRLGELALARKDYASSERRFKAVLALDPKDASAANNLAWIAVERGDKNAVAMARQALALSPDDANILDTLALAQAAAGQMDEAIKTQEKAIVNAFDQAPLRANLIKLLLKAGQKARAKTELEILEASVPPGSANAEALAQVRRDIDSK